MRIICLDTPLPLCDGSPLVRRMAAYGVSVGVWDSVSFRRDLGLVLRPVCEKVSCGLSRVPDKGVNAKASRRGLEWLGGLLWSLLEGNKAFIGVLHRDGVVSAPCGSMGEGHTELSLASRN